MVSRPDEEPLSGADDGIERCVLEVCDAVGDFIEYWGFKAILGRIWTLLALRRRPMNQAQIARRLGVSRALVSGAMRELVRRGLVRPIHARPHAPYEAVIDVWPTIADVLRSREGLLLERTRQALEGALTESLAADARGIQPSYDRSRMRLLLAMTDLAQALLRLLIALRGAPSLEAFSGWVAKASSFARGFRVP